MPGDPARSAGERGERDERRREFAGCAEVEVDAGQLARRRRRRLHRRRRARRRCQDTVAPNSLQEVARGMRRPGWSAPASPRSRRCRRRRARRRGTAPHWTGQARDRHRVRRSDPARPIHVPGSGRADLDAARLERRDRHLDVRQARQPLAGVRETQPLVEPGCRQQQAGHELAGCRRVDRQLTTGHAARCRTSPNGRVPRPSSFTSTPSARSASIIVRIGRRSAAGSPSNVTGPSASAATGGRKRITVPASPQSIVTPPCSSPGVMSRSAPNSPERRPLRCRCPSM